jgi:alcohol dehydrogenase class IV
VTPREYLGTGALDRLPDVLDEGRARRVLLVTGRGALRGTAPWRDLMAALDGREVLHLDQVPPHPEIRLLQQLLARCRDFQADLTLAVGGGSVLDMAKLLRFFAAWDGTPLEWLEGNRTWAGDPGPLVAVPTTAGPGSQATPFAVLYVGLVKHSIAHPAILPDVAIVDPALTYLLPPYETAVSGADALAQAIESFWSNRSTASSRAWSRQAMARLLPNLVAAARSPTAEARLQMAWGAHLAGKAIAVAQTTAAHAVSYPITARYGLPHGHAVALTLPALLVFNAGVDPENVQDPRGAAHVQAVLAEILQLLGASGPGQGRRRLAALLGAAGLELDPVRLGLAGPDARRYIVQNGFNPGRMANNPRRVTAADLARLLGRGGG